MTTITTTTITTSTVKTTTSPWTTPNYYWTLHISEQYGLIIIIKIIRSRSC